MRATRYVRGLGNSGSRENWGRCRCESSMRQLRRSPKREEEIKQHSEVAAEKITRKKERICEDGEETRR